MKHKIWLLALILIAVSFAGASEVPGNVKISLISQQPDPVEPGSYVDLRFKIENYGTDEIPQLYVELDESYPISLAGEKAERYLGNLWGGLNGDYGVVVKYHVKVADDASDGESKLRFLYRSGDSEWSEAEFDLNVRSIFDQVFVNSIKVEPEVIHPGDTADITFQLVNHGQTTMKDITVTMDLSASSTPFVPYGEISQKRLKLLKPSELSSLTFSIRADPNAVSQLYKVPITIEYYDSLNNKFTKSDVLGLEVGGKPQLFVGLDESEVYMPGATGEVVLNIVNNGETDVKFLMVTVPDNGDYVIIEGEEQYIGNLDSDDFETVKLKVHLKQDCSRFTLPVMLDYKDSLGNYYEEQVDIQIPYYNEAEALQYGLTQKSNTWVTVLVLLLIVALFFGYRWFKKRRRKA